VHLGGWGRTFGEIMRYPRPSGNLRSCRRLFFELNISDDDCLVESFGHVVDGEGGYGSGGERFHLNAGGAVVAAVAVMRTPPGTISAWTST